MPLAHDTYWRFFPEHHQPTISFANTLKQYLSQFGTVYDTGQLIDCPEHSREARLLFQSMDVDVVILATVTYSTPDDVLLDLKRFPRPVILWNTQASTSIPADLDFDRWMLEHGVTGVPGITNLLERENMPYFLVSGHYSSESVRQALLTALQALGAFKRIWGSRIGMFGHLYPGMIDFGYDPTMMYTTFGVTTVPILDSVVLKAYREVSPEDTQALTETLTSKYTVDPDFKGQELTNSSRLALAMDRVATETGLDAATVYCQSMWQNPDIGVVPCIGVSLLEQKGVFFSCEGDVLTALCGLMLGGLSRQAIFTEIWANDFDNDQFLMGHSGQMNLSLFEGNTSSVRVSRHPWWNGCCGRGACLQVKMPAGQATLLGLSPIQGNRWRMIVSSCEVTDRDPTPLGAPNFFIRLNKPITQYLEDLGQIGAAHHLAMAYGDWTNHLKALAKLFQVEYRSI